MSTKLLDITWEHAAPLPFYSKGHAQDVWEDRLLLIGGETGSPHKAWLYDPVTGDAEKLPDAPTVFDNTHIDWPDGKTAGSAFFYLTGIERDTANEVARHSRRVWRLTQADGRWQWASAPPLHVGRAYAGITVCRDTLVVVGGSAFAFGSEGMVPFGYDHAMDINAVEALDINDLEKGWVHLPPIPGMGRSIMAIAASERKIYVFGGYYPKPWCRQEGDRIPTCLCVDAYCLDMDTLQWQQLPDLPFPATGMTAVTMDERQTILVGGIKDSRTEAPDRQSAEVRRRPVSEVLVFDTEKAAYRILPTPLPLYGPNDKIRKLSADKESANFDVSDGAYRNGPRISVIDGKLYLLGSEVISDEANSTDEVLVGVPVWE